MCKNARNRCSVLVAMGRNEKNNDAISAYVKLLNGREGAKAVAVPEVQEPLD